MILLVTEYLFMRKKTLLLVIYVIVAGTFTGSSQSLQPGFNKAEYIEMMRISARTTADSFYYNKIEAPQSFRMIYESAVMGLDNLWQLWIKGNETAVISVRGTTEKTESWLANFYAAMIPAKGELKITSNETFKYDLADNPRAAVHIGWLLSTGFLSKDIVPKIDSLYKQGIKNFIIMGHSQGGAIACLLTSHLYRLCQQKLLPSDICFKTYCSAAPKPGNLYFAYHYEAITQNGWSFNVVNELDWVPETPVTVQTLDDYNEVNPFIHAKSIIKKQKFPKSLVLRHVYNQLDKPTKKARKRYQRYLGRYLSKEIKKYLKDYEAPVYYNSNHYVRAGNTIVLKADENYYRLFPQDKDKIFVNHFHQPYIYLAETLTTE